MAPTEPDKAEIIDARGLKCPLPVLKLEKHLDTGDALPVTLYADDPVARVDIPVLCNRRGLSCTASADGDSLCFVIEAIA